MSHCSSPPEDREPGRKSTEDAHFASICVCVTTMRDIKNRKAYIFLRNHEENKNKRNNGLTEPHGNARLPIKLPFGTLDKTAYTHTVINVPLHAHS